MSSYKQKEWFTWAQEALEQAGYRNGSARTTVLKILAQQSCCITAQQISEQINKTGQKVGLASIYRALETFERLKLVQRLDIGDGIGLYELSFPSGDHHHHFVCSICGKVEPFSNSQLELSIHEATKQIAGNVQTHDITLHGTCKSCS